MGSRSWRNEEGHQSTRYFTMSYPDKKGERTDKRLPKSKGIIDSELGSLRKLLSLLNVPISQTQVATGNPSKSQKSLSKSLHLHQRTNESRNKATKQPANEITELENFSVIYQNQRGFSSHPQHKIFLDIFTCLVRNRFTCREWFAQAPPENILRVLICLRLLMREPLYQKVFHELHGVGCLAQYMESVSSTYLKGEEQTFAMELLVNMAYIFQKLSAVEDQRAWVVEYGAHKTLVNLLSTRDSSVLLGALLALISLSEGPEQKEKLGELPIVENLLTILQDYDLLSKRMGAELLRLLCPDQRVREQVRALEGVPVLLSLLHSDHLKLLWSVTWVLVQLCADREAGTEIRVWGGVQQLLHLLHVERVYVSDRSSVETLSSANAASRIQRQHVSAEMSPQETLENTLSLQAACCAALTELVLDDATAYHVVQENGVYIIGKLILPRNSQPGPKEKSLQCYAFRTLRFLFSLERNRHLFKRVFSTELFEMFIDVGHYVRDITAYEGLQMKLCLLPEDELSSLKDNIEAVNLQKSPIKVINGYAILDHLGSGAFGSVFKVRKPNRQNTLALKEVNLHNPVFGKDKRDRDSSAEKIVSEITIIKEQMSHPNIVRYYKTFLENDHLYIVMEQIEGVPLADHINSTREKQQQFTEERVWNIFIQMCRALRYLHKDKRIVHRDLTPNNVMLGERDKVTITDFGLAKQKHENSKLTSVVGTILYSCPEIVKNEPYGEKADVWAAGCILYQTVTLRPPFNSTNMLSLVTKIVEAVYEPVGEGVYSERVSDVIKWCLTPDADLRPDIVEVGARISDLMMKLMDGLCVTQQVLERRLEGDRARAQKYFLETNRTQKSVSVQQRACIKDHGLACRGSRAPPSETVCSTCLPHTSSLRKLESSQDRRSPQQLPKASGKDSEDELDSTSNCDSSTSSPRNDLPLRSVKHSTSVTEEQCPACGDCAVPKAKPRPASAGICVSQRKVREIDDPIQKLLILLHKIIYISQLPPALYSFKRRAIERFKKSLFDYRSSPSNLKMELTKLLQGSPELVEQMSVSADWRSFRGKAVSAEDQAVSDNMSLQEGITYEHMSTIIEDILEEQGYYNKT